MQRPAFPLFPPAPKANALELDHDTAVDPPVLEILEDAVDVFQALFVQMRLDLALGGKGERFAQILATTDDRAAQGDALEHHIEDRRGKFARRQADHGDRALASHHMQRLRKCGR